MKKTEKGTRRESAAWGSGRSWSLANTRNVTMKVIIAGGLSREWSNLAVVWQFLGLERDDREVKRRPPPKAGSTMTQSPRADQPGDLAGACSGGKFVVSRAVLRVQSAQVSGPNLILRPKHQVAAHLPVAKTI
jgi:hypothetical protein